MDNQPPTIQCPTITPQTVNCGTPSTTFTFNQAQGTDNCGAVTVTHTAVSPTGTAIPLQAIGNVLEQGTFPVGTSVVTATATDGSGRTASCNVNVIVSQGIIRTYSSLVCILTIHILALCCCLGFFHLTLNVDLVSVLYFVAVIKVKALFELLFSLAGLNLTTI